MLSFKDLRCLLLLGNLFIIVSCATTNNKEVVEAKSEIIDNNEQINTAGSDGNKDLSVANKNLINLNLIDPMKSVSIPLSLIQGYDETTNLLLQKKNQKAVNRLEQLQQSHPDFSGPSYRLARVYQLQEKSTEAISAINFATKVNPNNYYAFNLKGLLLRENGDFEGSKQAYLEAIRIYPNYLNSELNLAILADMYLYDLSLALKHYERYMQLAKQLETSGDKHTIKQKKVSGWIADLKRRMPKDN